MGTGVALKGRWLPAAGILLVLIAVPLRAHHSLSAEYNTSEVIELHGTVSRVDWINPHIFIHLDVTRPDGTRETWQLEAGSPRTLGKARLSKKMLAVGTVVDIKGFPANNGSTRVAGKEIIFADGSKHAWEQIEPVNQTFFDWIQNSFPSSIRNWVLYVVIGMPVTVLIVGLFLLRSHGKKARATA